MSISEPNYRILLSSSFLAKSVEQFEKKSKSEEKTFVSALLQELLAAC